MSNTNETTQTVHPWRASWRSALAALPLVLSAVVVALPEVNSIIQDTWPDTAFAATAGVWLLGATAVASTAIAVINRLLLIPGINNWLTRLGLGPTPKGD